MLVPLMDPARLSTQGAFHAILGMPAPEIVTRRTLLALTAAAYSFFRTCRSGRAAKPPAAAKAGDVWINERDQSKLVYVPAGEFLMGSGSRDAEEDERPQHRVYLDAYWIGKYPITVGQYRRFVEATGYKTDDERDLLFSSGQSRGLLTNSSPEPADAPITRMSWYDAVAYCKWAGLRLPTEAEWEKGARGTDGRRYPWGNVEDERMYQLKQPPENGFPKPESPWEWSITAFDNRGAGSPYGMMCASSHFAQWCWDYYDSSAYRNAVSAIFRNPTGPSEPRKFVSVYGLDVAERVLRGGPGSTTTRRKHAPPVEGIQVPFGSSFRVAFGSAAKQVQPDTLTAVLDLSDRIGDHRRFLPFSAAVNDKIIIAPTGILPTGPTYQRDSDAPDWLLASVEAEGRLAVGLYREGLAILDRASSRADMHPILSYVRGDLYYQMAILQMLEAGSFNLNVDSVACEFLPDAATRKLLSMAVQAYQAAKTLDESPKIDLRVASGSYSGSIVPSHSIQHLADAERAVRTGAGFVIKDLFDLSLIAFLVFRMYADGSKQRNAVSAIDDRAARGR